AFVDGLTIRLGEGTSGRSLVDGVPVWTADLRNDPEVRLDARARELIDREGYRAVLSVPVWVKEAPYGSLATYWWEPRTINQREIERVSAIAKLRAGALVSATAGLRVTENTGRRGRAVGCGEAGEAGGGGVVRRRRRAGQVGPGHRHAPRGDRGHPVGRRRGAPHAHPAGRRRRPGAAGRDPDRPPVRRRRHRLDRR